MFFSDIDRPCGQPERPLRSVVRPYNKTVVQYSCQEGYTLNETSPFLNCVEGIWESPPPLCVGKYLLFAVIEDLLSYSF